MSRNVLLLIIVLTVAAAGLWFVSNKPGSYTQNTTQSQTLSSELDTLDSVDINSADSDLSNIDSESSSF